jgi:hypothetical protein
MCLFALSALVVSQPVDDVQTAAVGESVENDQQSPDAIEDQSDDQVGAESRWGYGGYGGYGHRRQGWGGGWGGYRRGYYGGYGGWGGYGGYRRGWGGYGGEKI